MNISSQTTKLMPAYQFRPITQPVVHLTQSSSAIAEELFSLPYAFVEK